MASIETTVELDIEEHLFEVSDSVLWDELQTRGFSLPKKKTNLFEQMKNEMFYAKVDEIPLTDLETFLKKYQ